MLSSCEFGTFLPINTMKKVVIIGNGVAGITAARHIRKWSDNSILVISSESSHFFSRTALMYVYMGHMRMNDLYPYETGFWKKNRIDLLQDAVNHVDTENQKLHLLSGKIEHYDILIIASGSVSNKFGWPGQNLPGVQGLYSLQDLELLERNTQPYNVSTSQRKVNKAVIVGGGLIGIELAEMLKSRDIDVTFLIRESRFWGNVLPMAESKLIGNHIQNHGIHMKYNSELSEITAGSEGRVHAIRTKSGECIDTQLVGLTAGVSPNIQFLKTSNIQLNRGVVVDHYLRTNVENVFAIGDCAELKTPSKGRKSIEQVWYTGRLMGETVAATIAKAPIEYEPGPWFNSAKFFDLEYHVYGKVNSEVAEDESHFYWEHPSGKHAIRLVFDKSTREFIGVNSIGLRLRHGVFDLWLRSGKTIDFVIAHLEESNFDPEFSRHFEREISAQFLLNEL